MTDNLFSGPDDMRPVGQLSLWRDLHDRHWALHACNLIVHFYAGRRRRHFYITHAKPWDHPNLFHTEFRRIWRAI